jgi:uncharacterized membrane protein
MAVNLADSLADFTIGDFVVAEIVAEVIEVLAIVVIAAAVVLAIAVGVTTRFRSEPTVAFEAFKRNMAKGLLIGLDLLIAADIIKTVTLESTLENVVILGLLVLIRTFLSWSLVLEVEGKWPWQQSEETSRP